MQSLRRSTRASSTAREALQKSTAVVTAALEAIEPRSKRAKRSQPASTNEFGPSATSRGGGGSSAGPAPQGISRYYEKQQWDKGFKSVAGVDEAGRGPLAGPVVAAACIIPPSVDIKNSALNKINDSKQLTEEEREELYELITAHPEIIWAVYVFLYLIT
jgi:ribonuclease HIII